MRREPLADNELYRPLELMFWSETAKQRTDYFVSSFCSPNTNLQYKIIGNLDEGCVSPLIFETQRPLVGQWRFATCK